MSELNDKTISGHTRLSETTDDIKPSPAALFDPQGRARLAMLCCFPYPPRILDRQTIARRFEVALERIALAIEKNK